MEAKELMVGDWVNYRGICNRVAPADFCHFEWIDDLRPIPLSPEILARMGFTIEEEPKYDDTYTEDEYTATIKCVDSRKCEVEIEYNTYWKKLRGFNHDPHNRLGFTRIETQIEYVHELQHIMRLLGIEKEIVL